jgi:NTE family protein
MVMNLNKNRFLLFLIILLQGCSAHYPVNEQIETVDFESSLRFNSIEHRVGGRSDDLTIGLAFSGGGTRASALSYGVLEALRDDNIRVNGKERRLLDEVDVISSVSGGSFTAAYYGLFGDRIFEDFEEKFLTANVQGHLKGDLFKPWVWMTIGSPNYGRSELAADYYDKILFENKTYADIQARGGPLIQINASEFTLGMQFSFTQNQFDILCSDLSAFPVSRAVAASSAVPGVFSDVTIDNYAGSCGYEMPAWGKAALNDPDTTSRRYYVARKYKQYLDVEKLPYIHLFDGGLTDNLGIQPFQRHMALSNNNAWEFFKIMHRENTTHVLFIVVNAQPGQMRKYSLVGSNIPLFDTIAGVSAIPLNEYTFVSLSHLRTTIGNLTTNIVEGRCAERRSKGEDTKGCDDFKAHLVVVDFDNVKDDEKREMLKEIPTSFSLTPEQVTALRQAGKDLLQESKEYQEFLNDMR